MRSCVVRMAPKRRRREGRGWKRNKVNLKFHHVYCVMSSMPNLYVNIPHCCVQYSSAILVFIFSQRNKPSQNEPGDGGVRGAGYTPIVKENARFVKYYQVMRGVGTCSFCTCSHMY